jgi:hypothetical protein
MPLNPRLAQDVSSTPLDPPPFTLEKHISLPVTSSAIWALGLSCLLLIAYRLLFAETGRPIPSLLWLMVASIVGAGSYLGIRFITYWMVWTQVVRTYPLVGRTHPAARGELPKRSFLFVLIIPIAASLSMCAAIYHVSSSSFQVLVLQIAVIAGIALRDMRALRHVLFLENSYWIRDVPAGLEVLRPVS